jgi:hypothetical protein
MPSKPASSSRDAAFAKLAASLGTENHMDIDDPAGDVHAFVAALDALGEEEAARASAVLSTAALRLSSNVSTELLMAMLSHQATTLAKLAETTVGDQDVMDLPDDAFLNEVTPSTKTEQKGLSQAIQAATDGWSGRGLDRRLGGLAMTAALGYSGHLSGAEMYASTASFLMRLGAVMLLRAEEEVAAGDTGRAREESEGPQEAVED